MIPATEKDFKRILRFAFFSILSLTQISLNVFSEATPTQPNPSSVIPTTVHANIDPQTQSSAQTSPAVLTTTAFLQSSSLQNIQTAGAFASFTLTVRPANLTQLPNDPTVSVTGHNTQGKRKPIVGYGTLAPLDRDSFAYKYDIGAGSGSTADVVIEKKATPPDNEFGIGTTLTLALKRSNNNSNSEGLSKVHILLEDSNGKKITRTVSLSNSLTIHNLDLSGEDFKPEDLKRITFRQSFEDLDPRKVDDDRRGQITVYLGGVDFQINKVLNVRGTAYNESQLTQLSEAKISSLYPTALTQIEGTSDRFLLKENPNPGIAPPKTVGVVLSPKDSNSSLALNQIMFAAKSNRKEIQGAATVTDANGKEAKFSFTLSETLNNYLLYWNKNSLADFRVRHIEVGFNLNAVKKIEIRVEPSSLTESGTELEIQLSQIQLPASGIIESTSIMHTTVPFSGCGACVSFTSVTNFNVSQLPNQPSIEASGYSTLQRPKPYVGYTSINSKSSGGFTYSYDLGAARGSAVDVTIENKEQPMSLGGQVSMVFKRTNKIDTGTESGLRQIEVIFVDKNENEISQTVELTRFQKLTQFDLNKPGFDSTAVKKIILRQTYNMLSPLLIDEERRGTISVQINGLAA